MSAPRVLRLLSLAGLLLLATCDDQPLTAPVDAPTMAISDAMHGDEAMRNPHFFFRGVWFGHGNVTNGAFDPALEPEVSICSWNGQGEWTAAACAHVVTFTTQGQGLQRVVMDERREEYRVRWPVWKYDLDPDLFYRIRVIVDGVELGFADVDVWNRLRELARIDRDEYVPLFEHGLGMWIRFRIEVGALQWKAGVFTAVDPDDLVGLDTGIVDYPDVVDRQFVYVNLDAISPSETQIVLHIDDATLTASLDKSVVRGPNDYSWLGHVNGTTYGNVGFARKGGVLVGFVHLPGVEYGLRPLAAGVYSLFEVDPSLTGPDAPAPPMSQPSQGSSPSDPLNAQQATQQSCGSDSIDVMVLYTDDVRVAEGSEEDVENLLNLVIDKANHAYESSGVTQRIRLVYSGEVDYAETGDRHRDLECLRDHTDNCLDFVGSLRDIKGADLVTLLVQELDVWGVGYLMRDLGSSSNADMAFSVVQNRPDRLHTNLLHEWGHNMGAQHDRAHTPTIPGIGFLTGVFDYSHGYRVLGQASGMEWTGLTVMAPPAECTPPCATTNLFSSPNISIFLPRVPTGVDHDVDPANSADNARTLNETYCTVVNWRAPSCVTVDEPDNDSPPTAPHVTLPLDLSGSFCDGDEEDFYALTLDQPTLVQFALDWDVLDSDLDILVLDPASSPECALAGATARKPEAFSCDLDAGEHFLSVNYSAGAYPVIYRLTVAAVGPGEIQGTVTVSGNPTPGAQVSLDETGFGATTNADGFYRFVNVTPGTYTVRAVLPGFGVRTEVVTVGAGETKTVDFGF